MVDVHTPVLEALRAVVHRLGDHQAPDDVSLPYGIFYAPDEGAPGGPASYGSLDRDLVVQVTAVGAGRLDCLRYLDDCRDVMVNLSLALSVDFTLMEPPQVLLRRMVMRDDKVAPPIFTWVEQYRLRTTPHVLPSGFSGYPSTVRYPSLTLYPKAG